MKSKWEIRQIDAIAYDDGWTYNESWHLGEMKTSSKHLHKAFTNWLRNTRGIRFGQAQSESKIKVTCWRSRNESPAGRCLLQFIRRGKDESLQLWHRQSRSFGL